MAIAHVATLSGGSQTSTGPFSYTSPSVSGSNTIGLAYALGGDAVDVVSAMTWNGTSMTFIAKVLGSVNHYSYAYYILNPTAGATTISVTYSGNHFMSGGASVYSGVKQSGQPDNSGTNTGSGTSLTTSLTTVADNCWTTLFAGNNVGANSAGTGSTARTNTSISWDIFDSNGVITPAGSYSMAFSCASSQLSAIITSISPFTTNIKTYNGLAIASVKTVDGLAIASVKTRNGLA